LVIVGDGQPVMDRLIALRELFGIAARVHLLGYRQGACRLMAGFDIFALATHKEAAGTVFLEAAVIHEAMEREQQSGQAAAAAREDNQ
ncbi:glycosyltransferase, partial [Rhodococcus sp. NPDC058514]|uniref:glycosyltransferase n=1 Tax=Rhodococcus sp. NPDC058514 TaxID=3346532 RepID=UPI0036689238